MARYVIVVGGIVDNVTEWDGNTDPKTGGWAPPAGAEIVAHEQAQIGWRLVDGKFQPPAPPPITVPDTVSPRQLKLALLKAGLLDKIDAFVASTSTPRDAQISWEYATEYRRDNAMLNHMATLLTPPLSVEAIDQLFIAAAAIQ